MDVKKRLKKEAHYMKRGAKLLPKIVAKKIAEKGKAWWEQQKEIGELHKQARKAEREAYKMAVIKEAKKRGNQRAKKPVSSGFDFDSVSEILLGSHEEDEK